MGDWIVLSGNIRRLISCFWPVGQLVIPLQHLAKMQGRIIAPVEAHLDRPGLRVAARYRSRNHLGSYERTPVAKAQISVHLNSPSLRVVIDPAIMLVNAHTLRLD